ncbi:MAG TPA: MoaD/ThiS family protein [Gemmatimonadaceae bacterium]
MITVELPRALADLVGGRTTVTLEEPCATAGEALSALSRKSAAVADRVLDERGEVRPHVNVFVGEESIRFLQGLDTPLTGDSRILIIAAVSGG